MSTLRQDVTTRDWVIFAPERARRPVESRHEGASRRAGPERCPFCPRADGDVPEHVLSVPPGRAWRVRVLRNKHPALERRSGTGRASDGPLFRHLDGHGVHEVVVETPEHASLLAHQDPEHVALLLETLRGRTVEHLRDPRVQSVVVFKNHGERAGASLAHPHWQVIATPVVPRLLRLKHAVATDHFDATGRCLYCVLLEEELARGERVLAVNDAFAAVLPYASNHPFETWLLPRAHAASFGAARRELMRPLAELLQDVLGRLHAALGDPDFNLTVHSAPRGDEEKDYFLWHVEVVPRLTTPAGFELGSGMSINPVLPEEAARVLREVSLSPRP